MRLFIVVFDLAVEINYIIFLILASLVVSLIVSVCVDIGKKAL